jgi:hypothetical protein
MFIEQTCSRPSFRIIENIPWIKRYYTIQEYTPNLLLCGNIPPRSGHFPHKPVEPNSIGCLITLNCYRLTFKQSKAEQRRNGLIKPISRKS